MQQRTLPWRPPRCHRFVRHMSPSAKSTWSPRRGPSWSMTWEVTELVLAAGSAHSSGASRPWCFRRRALDALELDPVESRGGGGAGARSSRRSAGAAIDHAAAAARVRGLYGRGRRAGVGPVGSASGQHNTTCERDHAVPRKTMRIERLGKKIEVAAFSPGIDSGHNVLELRLRVCMYQPGPIKHKPKIAIFGRAILDGVGEVCRSKRDTRQRRTLDRQVGSRCPGREAPAARHLFELTHRNGRARCAAKIAFV